MTAKHCFILSCMYFIKYYKAILGYISYFSFIFLKILHFALILVNIASCIYLTFKYPTTLIFFPIIRTTDKIHFSGHLQFSCIRLFYMFISLNRIPNVKIDVTFLRSSPILFFHKK